jgi:hypothetical protein
MRVGGVTVTGPTEEILVLPRTPEPVVFRAVALPNMDEFFKLCPEPKPPGKLTKDGWIPDPKAPGYLEILEKHAEQRLGYMMIRSLAPSEIEWDTVEVHNPKTWSRWQNDLLSAGLTQVEVNRVAQLVTDANGLNEAKLERAREVFLRGRARTQSESSSPDSAPESSPSGEPALASA